MPRLIVLLSASFVACGTVACSSSVPSVTPLSGDSPRVEPRKSSSRAEESGGEGSRVDATPPAETNVDIEDPGDDDSSGTGFDCRRLGQEAGESCLGVTLAARVCETWGPLLDSQVGEVWLDCLAGPEPSSLRASCQTSRITACAFQAIGRVRTDGAYGALCEEVAKECAEVAPELNRTACERAITAFRPEARAKIAECLQHGCRTGAFGSCIP